MGWYCTSSINSLAIDLPQMDQRPYPGPGKLFHLRMATLFVILWTIDLIMFVIAIENTIAHGVGGMILFASEVRMSC